MKTTIIVVVVGVLGWGVWNLNSDKKSLEQEVFDLATMITTLQKENSSLSKNIEYYKNPQNLLKEVKSQFNFKEANEGLIIIVPSATSSPTSTQ